MGIIIHLGTARLNFNKLGMLKNLIFYLNNCCKPIMYNATKTSVMLYTSLAGLLPCCYHTPVLCRIWPAGVFHIESRETWLGCYAGTMQHDICAHTYTSTIVHIYHTDIYPTNSEMFRHTYVCAS